MSYMHTVIRSAIETGGKPLSEVLESIDAQAILGRISAEEAGSLAQLARSKARPADSMDPLLDRVAELERKVAALEAGRTPAAPDQPSEDWPAFVHPSGAHDAYYAGDRVTWQGRRWECSMDGCVWSPTDYPAAWREVVDADNKEA